MGSSRKEREYVTADIEDSKEGERGPPDFGDFYKSVVKVTILFITES